LETKNRKFEKKFGNYIGKELVVGLNSGTSALDMALKLLNIGYDDEVIVPTITFVSTAHAVVYNHARPIFADVDETTLNIDFNDVERKVSSKTKAIIPVHYGGVPVNVYKLKKMVDLPIIEDCAHACGSSLLGGKCGSLGDIGCFSFHAVKNLAMGDGGAIVVNDKSLFERAKRLKWLGIDKGTWDRTKMDNSYWWEYFVNEIGLKCHMNDIQAAIGLVQLKKLDEMNKRRKEIANTYTSELKNVSWIETPPDDTDISISSWHIYRIKCKNGKRNKLSSYLEENDISTGVHYKPIHLYKCYGYQQPLPVAEKVFSEILSLPIFPDLTNNELEYIIECIKKFKE